jgi:hypothetical protein
MVFALAAALVAMLFTTGVAWGMQRCGHAIPPSTPAGDWYTYVPPVARSASAPGCVTLPTVVVWALANSDLVAWQAAHHAGDIAAWMGVLVAEGQTQPLEVLVDRAGRASLSDGYRRLAAARRLGTPHVVVRIVRTGELRRGPMLVDVLLANAERLGW